MTGSKTAPNTAAPAGRDGAGAAGELLAMVQRLQKEADARAGQRVGRTNVPPDTTVALGEEAAPGADQGAARENSVAYVPPIPPGRVSDTQTLRILSVRMVRGWTRGEQSAAPPPPAGTGSLIDGGLGNFQAIIR